MNALEAAIDAIADRVAAVVVQRLRGDTRDGWIDQRRSPLGARRHCAVARARMDRGEVGAAKVGRRYLLSQEALNEALASGNRRTVAAATDSIANELRREIALVRGARAA
jgi:hypothetical protein